MPRRRKTPEPKAEALNEKEIEQSSTDDSGDLVSDGKTVLSTEEQNKEIPKKEDQPLNLSSFSRKIGPDFKIDYYHIQGDVKAQLRDVRTGRPSAFEDLIAVRTEREGGNYYKIEFFFPHSRDDISYSAFDNKELTVITGRTKEGKLKGRRFTPLVCTGKLRGVLPEDPAVRLMKYVCRTDNQIWVELTPPRSLKGLGVPIERK